MTPEAACAWVVRRLGGAALRAVRLEGGLLNHVFRVFLPDGRTVVVKQAPPYVARAPHIPLDPARSAVEAAALRFLAGRRAPRLLDAHAHTLILEDVGDVPDLLEWLRSGGDPVVLDHLAAWLRALHDRPGPPLENRAVQSTRLAVQYEPLAGWLARAGVEDAEQLGRAVVEMGRRFQAGGPCFVMGDLWPPSVRVRDVDRFVVLDWELATTGHRAQDVGHLLAHLELASLWCGLDAHLGDRFRAAYGALAPSCERDVALHRGAELLTRAIGAFPMAELSPDQRRHAVARAVDALRSAGPAVTEPPAAP